MDVIFGEIIKNVLTCHDEEVPKVERVEYRSRATIVFFEDGTKSVAKCNECKGRIGHIKPPCVLGLRDPQKDEACRVFGYSKEAGLITALAKRQRPDVGKLVKEWC